MAKGSKTKDIGWMYYTPNKREDKDAVQYPPPSQIPGLGAQPDQPPPEERRILIKETDSPYIRLAKQGGRQDLLSFKENKRRTEAKDYPRCEWFYQEDNVEPVVDEVSSEPYVFKLPEYMVHKEPKVGNTNQPITGPFYPSRLPYATDNITVYERDDKCTDKTVNIPNIRRGGYGVRQEKQKDCGVKHTKLAGPKQKKSAGPRIEAGTDPTNMHKLLAGTYEREWHERRAQWEAQQPEKAHGTDKMSSEYRDSYHKMMAEKSRKAAAKAQGMEGDEKNGPSGESKRIDREIEKMEKEVFKLSRFKNVNSKVETNRQRNEPGSLYIPSQSDAPKRTAFVT